MLCGDTFDSPDLDERQLRAGIEILEELAPIPVLILPGNHDPWQPGGIWQRRAWR